MKNFERFGYETKQPCDVCGKEGLNRLEPRFYYAVCEEHYKLTPVQVGEMMERRENKEMK